jgi:hypothetical protein
MSIANLLSSSYFHNLDRQQAQDYMIQYDTPVFRPSSIAGHYAATLKYKNRITHFLLKAYPDLEKIEVVAGEDGNSCAFPSFSALLSFVLSSHTSRVSDPIPP